MNTAATTYEVREITDARVMPRSGMASFATMEAAVSWLNETFDVLCGEEFDGQFDGIVRPKGKPFMIPMQINIAAHCPSCSTGTYQYTCEDCWQPA